MDWVKIFTSKQEARKKLMAGKPQLLLVGNTRICLVFFDDKIYAMEDKCSHNGESLSKGTVNYLGEVVCPWHGYRFTPQTGRETGERSRDLKTYPVKEDDSGVFVWI
jgi:nitrite reductase/ring-hydroxylating ferredoxin subunit